MDWFTVGCVIIIIIIRFYNSNINHHNHNYNNNNNYKSSVVVIGLTQEARIKEYKGEESKEVKQWWKTHDYVQT